MVNPNQLALTQSPISSLIPSVGNTVTVKLDDSNYVTWNFQMDLLLEGNGIMGFIDGSISCPKKFETDKSVDGAVDTTEVLSDAYKIWKIHDKALMTLFVATLSTSALSSIIGSQSAKEMWENLRERFASVTRTSIVQLKIDLQNTKKWPESIDQYLQRIKDSRDQLAAVGVTISDEDIVIVALRSLPSEYNTIKAVIRGRENLVSLKELRSQLKAEESTLAEVHKQIPLMSAMYAQGARATYDSGQSSGHNGIQDETSLHFSLMSMQPMPMPMSNYSQPMPVQMPMPSYFPCAFPSQYAFGSFNNFRGPNNFKSKGKGKRFSSGFQSSSQSLYGANNSQNLFPSPFPSVPAYNPSQICQICDKKGHSALNCFQNGCQICHRKGHTAATCFDRNASSQFHMAGSSFHQMNVHPSSQFSSVGDPPSSYFRGPHIQQPVSYQASQPVAMQARANVTPSARPQDFWLLDSSATNHMTSDISNLPAAVPYPSTETITSAGGEGLSIAHFGNTVFPTKSHTFQLNSVLHVPKLSQDLLSMYQLCKDNICRCIVDESSICIQDKVTGQVLYQGLSNNAVYPIPVFKSSSSTVTTPAAFLGQKVSSDLWHCRSGQPRVGECPWIPWVVPLAYFNRCAVYLSK